MKIYGCMQWSISLEEGSERMRDHFGTFRKNSGCCGGHFESKEGILEVFRVFCSCLEAHLVKIGSNLDVFEVKGVI